MIFDIYLFFNRKTHKMKRRQIMTMRKKQQYRKTALSLLIFLIVFAISILGMSTNADAPEGQSGDTSAISSEAVSSGETSSEDVSSEMTPQPFSTRAGARTYDMRNGPLVIAPGSGVWEIYEDYKGSPITGKINGVGTAITVQIGYEGRITLAGTNIITENDTAGMVLESTSGESNDNPKTKVELFLEKSNSIQGCITGDKSNTFRAGIEVSTGTQITIDSKKDTSGNWFGSLIARAGSSNNNAGAGIGSGKGSVVGIGGGNVIIKGGDIEAYGGDHGAGIGYGHGAASSDLKNPMNVIILGGKVKSVGGNHANGIGKGCSNEQNGILLVLPPAEITASTLAPSNDKDYKAVGGSANNTVYIGDPASNKNTVRTKDTTKNADVYIDFTTVPGNVIEQGLIMAGLDKTSAPYATNKYKIGNIGSTGIYNLYGEITAVVTIFTDAKDSVRIPYLSQSQALATRTDVVLPKANANVSATLTQGTPAILYLPNTPGTAKNKKLLLKMMEIWI